LGDHFQPDFKVLVKPQALNQIAEAELEKYGKNLPVAIQMPVGSANYAYGPDTQHGFPSNSGQGQKELEGHLF